MMMVLAAMLMVYCHDSDPFAITGVNMSVNCIVISLLRLYSSFLNYGFWFFKGLIAILVFVPSIIPIISKGTCFFRTFIGLYLCLIPPKLTN